MNNLERVQAGFNKLDMDDDKRDKALENISKWLTEDRFSIYRKSIEDLIDGEEWDLLLYNFFQTLPFGTGGRRGPVGIGPNTYNSFTLCSSVQGHVNYMRSKFGDRALTVVIAFDVRRFLDLKGRYGAEENSPVFGLSSRDFAKLAAEVYAANGVSVFMPDPHGEWLISTPELSYAIRHVGAAGGLNVSASHNHPDDNGGKFYDEFGGQEVPPNDEHFSNLVELVEVIDSTPFDKALKAGKITYLSHEEIHTGYINLNRNLSRRPQARSAKIVFTNLHGAGDTNVGDVLQSAGFDVHYVPAQRKHDGQFPNVPFQIANPEVPESMEQAVALAKSIQADVVFSTDPDADRIGVMAPGHDGEFVFLTGNEIGALTTDQVFACMAEDGDLPKRPIFVTTEVTSRLPGAIARTHNSQVVDDLLVGCKYIANVISSLENNQEFRHISGSPADYVIGLEESHGLMVSTSVRDKDAAGAAIMLAERASLEKARGKTLVDALYDLYRKVGVHIARQVSIVIEGAVGMEKIASMQRGFRELQMGGTLGGRTITKKDDFLDEAAHGSFLSGTDEKARNFISFEVDGGFRVLVRPSGTEPKIKLYAEVIGNPLGANASDQAIEEERMLLNEQLQTVMDDVAQQGYELLGLNMPRFALRCSPLLGLDARIDFANRFVNELATTSAEKNGDALGAWIDTRLSSYGKDARGLIKWGVQEWLSSTEIPLGDAERLAIQMAFDLSSQ